MLLRFAAIAALACALYAGTLDVPFVLDDAHNVAENPHIRIRSLSPAAVWDAGWKSPSASRPVANASFALSWWWGGDDPRSYHVVNVAIHALNGILVYLLALQTLVLVGRTSGAPALTPRVVGGRTRGAPALARRRRDATALFTALLFVAHPLQVQSVTYVVQRMTSLAALFYLTALLLWLEARLRAVGGRRAALFAGAVVAWMLALGSKQIAVTLPAVLLLFELWLVRDLDGRWLRRSAPWIGAALLASAAIALLYLRGDPGRILASYAGRDFDVGERVLTQFRVLVFYIGLVLLPLPSRLNLLHGFPVSRSLVDPWTTLPCLAAVVGLVLYALWVARRHRVVSFCILWFFGQLALESSLIGLEMVFEHRLYLPLFGPALLAAYAGALLLPGPRAALAVGLAAVALLSTGTLLRNHIWRDRLTLWSDVVAKNPGSPRAHNSLGRALEQEERFDEATRHFETALRLRPEHTEAHFNLGVVAWRQGRVDDAIRHYGAALRAQPDYAKAHNNLAAAYASRGRFDEAAHHFERTIGLDPWHVNARFNLGLVLERQGRVDEARRRYEEVLRLVPEDAGARQRLEALEPRGSTAGAR